MRRALAGALLLLGVAAAANALTVALAPRAIHALVAHRLAARGGINTALHAPRADAQARLVVRPSPDLLYTACVFDLGEHPLHVTGPLTGDYASLAAFADNTDNFFAVDDETVARQGATGFDVVLARTRPPSLPAGARLVISPSRRGLVLFRLLVSDDAALARLVDLQHRQRCEPLQ